MIALFFILLGSIAFTYFGYPLLLTIVGARRRDRGTHTRAEDALPTLTLLIVAHNEENVLPAKLENSLSLDYPRHRLEIVVASDASTDGTDAIARTWADRGVRLIRRPERGSQTGAQNYAAPRSRGSILVFSEANTMYDRAALRRLVRHFDDPTVGCVVGRLAHSNAGDTAVSFGEELYWRYESHLKRMQSRAGALLFANGAIYAVRRSLYRPVEGDWDHDTMVPLRCVLAGSRVVYEPHALAYEKAGTTARGELRRKVRIIMRDAWTLVDLARVHVGLTPWLLFNVLCHKVIRWLVWLPLVGLLALSVINFDHAFFRVTLAAQLAFYVAALAGKLIERRRGAPIWLRVPLYFCLVNTAGLLASVRMLRGERQTFWNPRSGA